METLFPTDLKPLKWQEFRAEGFSEPVAGLLHTKAHPARNGMPLGGIGTGCIDLETDGTFGYTTVFNSHVPRRGPLNLPFIGLSLNNKAVSGGYGHGGYETWVLSTRRMTGESFGGPTFGQPAPRCLEPATDILYWGHYPVADLEFVMDCPLRIGLRAWAPFVPGDTDLSNTPGAVFEMHLRNPTDRPQSGTLAFSFPGPSARETAGHATFTHTAVDGPFRGVVVDNGHECGYALGIVADPALAGCRTGGDLGTDGYHWSNLVRQRNMIEKPYPVLPAVAGQPGASVAVDFEIPAGESRLVRFVLAWHAPTWLGGGQAMEGGNTYRHQYAARFGGAGDTARFLAENHAPILARILAWQQVLYSESKLPVWLREALVNNLHLIAECGMWAEAQPPIGDWCRKEDGLFALNECPRACPQMACIPCDFYGNIPLVYFFPDLARSTLRGFKACQYPNGQVPFVFGGSTVGSKPCELVMPSAGYPGQKTQATLDGPCYVDMIGRLWLRTGDRAILDEFYESLKRNTIFTMNLRPGSGPAGIVSLPTDNLAHDWMEYVDLFGIVPHIGGVHLANLRMAERMARAVGDNAFADQCAGWLREGSEVMEAHTWTGTHYQLYNEVETGKESDVILGCQLDGDWMARFHGVETVFRPERAKATLATLKKTNHYRHGATVFRDPADSRKQFGYWTDAGVHFPSSIMLAALHLYHGDARAGLDLAERSVRALAIENRASWESYLLYRGDTAELLYGPDYYQNMMLWALPAAIAGTDLSGLCQPGGLVARMVEAAKP